MGQHMLRAFYLGTGMGTRIKETHTDSTMLHISFFFSRALNGIRFVVTRDLTISKMCVDIFCLERGVIITFTVVLTHTIH